MLSKRYCHFLLSSEHVNISNSATFDQIKTTKQTACFSLPVKKCSSVWTKWLLNPFEIVGQNQVFSHLKGLVSIWIAILVIQSELSLFKRPRTSSHESICDATRTLMTSLSFSLPLFLSLSLSLPIQALMENGNLNFVKPAWIYAINERQKLLPYQPYSVVPWTIHCMYTHGCAETHAQSSYPDEEKAGKAIDFFFFSFSDSPLDLEEAINQF